MRHNSIEYDRQYYAERRERLRAKRRAHFRVNKVKWNKYVKDYRDSRTAFIDSVKSKPCTDCEKTYPPYVMDFDHVRGEKSFNISRGKCISKNKLLEEIAKCDVVCANCHRERTHGS